MVKGLPKVKANVKPSPTKHALVVLACSAFALSAGYFAATRPDGAGWREPFSYHPLLMTVGWVGCVGSAAITKKVGGYTNTKIHGYLSSAGLLSAFAGLYFIYTNKEKYSKPHFTSSHSIFGLVTLLVGTAVMSAGGILLHPDFGVAKTNKTYRFIHHWAGKIVILMAWFSCFYGLMGLTTDANSMAMFGVPLLGLYPLAIM